MQSERRTDSELEKLIGDAVNKAFANILDGFGADITTSQGRQELREDFSWLRDARRGTALVRKTAGLAMITTFISGAAFGLWTMLVWVASLAHVKGNGP